MIDRLAVVVVAGGEGRRMGGDKPLRRLAGVSLIARALGRARSYGPQVAVAVRTPDQVAGEADAPLLCDRPGLAGPLAGLASGLEFARDAGARRLMIMPCDMPCLPHDLAARLDGALEAPARMAAPCRGGRVHPACSVWDVACGDELPAYVASGRLSLMGFGEWVGMREVPCEDWGDLALANVNTAGELALLESALARQGMRATPAVTRSTPIAGGFAFTPTTNHSGSSTFDSHALPYHQALERAVELGRVAPSKTGAQVHNDTEET